MRRRLLATAVLGLAVTAAPGWAKPDDHKPPKPKPPRLELLTESEDAALRTNKIKIGVESEQGRRVRVEAEMVIEGIPDNFHFAFKPQRKRLRHREATVAFKLNGRQREVLAFAAQACMGTDVNAQGKVGKRVATIHGQLEKPPEC
jgi:hypothetical protein